MILKKYFISIVVFIWGFFVLSPSSSHALSDQIYKELESFSRIIEIVDEQYVDPVNEHNLIVGAIDGMLFSLDPHTLYMPPDVYRDFKSDTSGQFGGIGIEITVKNGILTVVSPVEDSPADRAGIHSGDRIMKINGEATKGMSLIDAVHKMRGPRGKKVTLTMWREGSQEHKDFVIERDIINVVSVKYELIEGGEGYARITSFQEKATDDLKKAIKSLEAQNRGPLKGLVIDLRDNPGGLLSEAIRVADLFIENGVIVSTRGRTHELEVKYAKKNSDYEKLPLVVLVNRGSASASEILAGALQDTNRAKILGINSFGKGTVQTIVELGNKAALKITIARYYTPKNRSIDGKGIKPDIPLGPDELKKDYPKKEGKDRPDLREYQKQKAIDYLKRM